MSQFMECDDPAFEGLSRRLRFSSPATTRSIALLKSSIVTDAPLTPGSKQRRFIDQIRQICAGEARRQRRNLLRFDIGYRVSLFSDARPESAHGPICPADPPAPGGRTARPAAGRIKDLGPVGRRQQHHAAFWIETVKFSQELIQRLLLFVMPAKSICAASSPQRIQFIDKNDRGGHLTCLLEQIAHSGGADADEHLDKFGAGNREERDTRFARDRACQ